MGVILGKIFTKIERKGVFLGHWIMPFGYGEEYIH